MKIRDAFFGIVLVSLFVLSLLVLLPFFDFLLGAALLAFALMPAHRRLLPTLGERLSALSLTLASIVVSVVPAVFLLYVVLRDAAESPDDLAARPILAQIQRLLNQLGLPLDIPMEVRGIRQQLFDSVLGEAATVLGASARIAIGFSLMLFFLYYLLLDGRSLVDRLMEEIPLPDSIRDPLYERTYVVTWAVLKGHIFVGIVQSLLAGIGFYVAGVPNPVFWTLVMVLFSFVPLIGVAAIWVPASFYLLVTGDIVAGAALFIYGATVISWVDNYLRAIVVTRGASVHPAIVLAGAIGGIYFMGALGLFIGPIILAVFEETFILFVQHYDTY